MSNQTQSNISERNSEDNDRREIINDGEEGSFDSSIPASASTYVYRDYSQERSEPTWFDQRFENLLQTADQKRKLPAKLNTILSDPELSSIITWLPHGRSWRIIDRQNFINNVLPPHFGHNKHASFIRLVNAWGFRRIPSGVDKDSYFHELFLRGMPHLHKRMRRLVFHESKAPIDDENWIPNFYEMPLLDEVANAAAPVQKQRDSAICDSTSTNIAILYPPSNTSRSEMSSAASTSTGSATFGIGLPTNEIYSQQVINSLKMVFRAQQPLISNSSNPAIPLPPGVNPLMLQNSTNTLAATQPYYASLMQTQCQQRSQQYQQHGQQMNDFQSSTNDGHHPYQANESVDQAGSDPGRLAIASTTYHIQLEQQQHSQAGTVPTVFVPGEGANTFSTLEDQATPGMTQQSLQQQQLLQLQLQQNLSSFSSNQELDMRPLFIQAINQQQQQGLAEARAEASVPYLSLSATPEQLNSPRSMTRVQTQSSNTFATFLEGDISNSSGEDIVGYPGFIATASHDRSSSHNASTENSLSVKRTLPQGHSTLSRNNAQKNNDEKTPGTSSNGKKV